MPGFLFLLRIDCHEQDYIGELVYDGSLIYLGLGRPKLCRQYRLADLRNKTNRLVNARNDHRIELNGEQADEVEELV